MLQRIAVVVLEPVLVTDHLPVELIDQRIDGGIHVVLNRFHVNVVAAHA